MSNPCVDPVFVVGCPRSGTTLLYNILEACDDFPRYAAETHLLDVCMARRGALHIEAHYRGFMREFLASQQFSRSGLDAESFADEARGHHGTWIEFLDFFMTRMAARQGKRRWCDNTPLNVLHLESLARELPGARFIHIIRDGRDVAASLRQMGWSGLRRGGPIDHLVASALWWRMVVEIGRETGAQLGDRYMEIHYADLAQNPHAAVRRIGEHIGADLNYGRLAERSVLKHSGGNSAFGRLSGISSDPVDRWRRTMAPEEKEALHSAIGPALSQLGYDVPARDYFAAMRLPRQFHTMIRTYPKILKLKHWLRSRTPLGRLSRAALEPAFAGKNENLGDIAALGVQSVG